MPIVQFHLVEGRHSEDAVRRLLIDASDAYVDILYPDIEPRPLDRVRAFITWCKPTDWATAGVLIAEGGGDAPYFTCLALAGRPTEQLQALLSTMTELIVECLGVLRSSVRGRVIPIEPDLWSIGGQPAAVVRRAEVAARIPAPSSDKAPAH